MDFIGESEKRWNSLEKKRNKFKLLEVPVAVLGRVFQKKYTQEVSDGTLLGTLRSFQNDILWVVHIIRNAIFQNFD
jgi:hypothetical protein